MSGGKGTLRPNLDPKLSYLSDAGAVEGTHDVNFDQRGARLVQGAVEGTHDVNFDQRGARLVQGAVEGTHDAKFDHFFLRKVARASGMVGKHPGPGREEMDSGSCVPGACPPGCLFENAEACVNVSVHGYAGGRHVRA
jgi:hypothetical protein